MNSKSIHTNNGKEKNFSSSDFIALVTIIALLLIDYFPYNQTMEIINPQFRYLSFLNIFLGIYCYFKEKNNQFGFFSIFRKNYVANIYLLFLFFCCLSLFVAKNSSLVFTKLTQVFIVFSLFINLSITLKNKRHLIYHIVFIVCIAAFFQSGQEFLNFIKQLKAKSIIDALNNLKGNTGNINILAASLTVKVPFLLIAITHFKNFKRIFLISILLLVTIVIFLTGARTPLLSLFGIYTAYLLFYFKENSFVRSSIFKTTLLIIPIIAAIFIANLFFKESKDKSRYVSLQNRVEQINADDASASARLYYWKNVAQITINHPFLGIGLGNYQIESIPFERLMENDSSVSLHAHNDFLEITAETGILNGVIYFLLFVVVVYINLKRIIRPIDKTTSEIAILCLMIVIAYTLDSFFNFPMYRPTMQIFFCLLLALTVVNKNYITESSKKAESPAISIIFIIFNVVLCYSATLINKASNLEYLIQTDDINVNASGVLTGDEVVKRLPKYPNVFSTSESFYEYAGIYYLREKNYSKALNCFSKANKINPYLGRVSFYKNIMSVERGNIDSAYIYSKEAFYLRPRNSNFYRTATQIAAMKGDTLEILKEHQIVTKYRNSPEAWITAGEALGNAGFSRNKLIDFINKGIKDFPNDSTLLKKKNSFLITNYIIKGQEFGGQGKRDKELELYQKALKIDPKNIYALQNIGFCYFNQGKNDLAIPYFKKAIEYPGLDDGKTEFYIGSSYLRLNDKTNACKYFEIANSKNFPDAKAELNQNCK